MRLDRRLLGQLALVGLTTAVIILILLPALSGILVSFKPNRELFAWPPSIVPRTWVLEPYISVLSEKKYLRYFFNTALIASTTCFVCVILGSLAGYGFSRFKIPGKQILMLSILALRMFPGPVLMIPYFKLAKALNLFNTYYILIMIDSAFALPVVIWLLKGYFDSIPVEVEEAAMIDGCSRIRALLLVIAPLCRAGVIAVGVYTVLKAWNEFMFAMILTKGPEVQPISVGLADLFGIYNVSWNSVMAITTLSIVPLVIIFIFLQRYIISGITSGAVK